MRAPRRSQHGGLLLECVIALGVLFTGSAAVVAVLGNVSQTSKQIRFHALALSMFGQLSSEVGAATCNVGPGQNAPTALTADPGLLVVANQWQTTPVANSNIQTIGAFNNLSPRIVIDYRLNPTVGAPVNSPPSFDVQVRIRQVMNDAAKDSLDALNTHWIKTFPVKKTCAFRSQLQSRGGYP